MHALKSQVWPALLPNELKVQCAAFYLSLSGPLPGCRHTPSQSQERAQGPVKICWDGLSAQPYQAFFAATSMMVMQVNDLASTIDKVPADAVVVATPMDLNRLIHISKPSTRVA